MTEILRKRINTTVVNLPNDVTLTCRGNPNKEYENYFCEMRFSPVEKIDFEIQKNGHIGNTTVEDNNWEVSFLGSNSKWHGIRNKKNNNFVTVADIGFGRSRVEVYDYGTDKLLFKKVFKESG